MNRRPAWGLALLVAASPLAADAISSRQEDLRRLKRELSRKEKEARETDARAKELKSEVDRISRELRSSQGALKEVDTRLRETERRRSDAENRLWAARLDVKQWNRTLSDELRMLYERRAAAESARFVELAWRRRLAQDKIAAMTDALARHQEMKASHQELVEVKAEFEGLHAEREKEAERVREAKTRMTKLFTTVQGRRAVLENDIRELNAAARRFEGLIQDLLREREKREAARAAEEAKHSRGRKSARRPKPAAASAPDFGKLPWPIEGAVVARFGKFKHPELDTVVVSNGIKIRPSAPGPVRAAAKGEVLYAGEFMGYGLMALVAHADSLFTIYAHLGELKVKKGQDVSVGEILGSTGADADERPVVYFELRLRGEAMDPLLWLK